MSRGYGVEFSCQVTADFRPGFPQVMAAIYRKRIYRDLLPVLGGGDVPYSTRHQGGVMSRTRGG